MVFVNISICVIRKSYRHKSHRMSTETDDVEMLNSSRLGTQEYWEGLYQKENQNYEHHGKVRKYYFFK